MPGRINTDVKADDSNSVASFDSTGKRKSFRRLITRFAEKTSMQGVPYINNAKFWWAKLLWGVLLLAAISAMVWHLWFLFSQYYTYPKQTTITLGFSNLRFPQVTICNTNRIHKGRLDHFNRADELKKLVNALLPENLVPNQYDPNYDANDSQAANRNPQSNTNTQPTNINADNTTQQPPPSGSLPATDSGSTSVSPSSLPPRPPLNKRQKRFVDDNYAKLDPKAYKPDYKPNDRVLNDDEYDSPVDSRTALIELFEELFMDVDKIDRGRFGHNITDMLLSCTFSGRQCTADQFTLHQTSEYGNCWSLDSKMFNVQNAGPSGGLSLILYLESTEYLTGISTGYGARIHIHEPNTLPLPEEEGIFIPASMETNIGLKKVNIERLGKPYGECNEGNSFQSLYRRKYTISACQSLCKVTKVIRTCSCFDNKNEETAMKKNSTLHPCRSTTETACLNDLLQKFDRKEITCPCQNPCSETSYEMSLSNRQWPNDDYARVLLQAVCDSSPDVCRTLRGNLADSRALNHNFLKLNIYYKELNYENIDETAAIEESQFLADVGGAVGLWIGLSILSLCEVIQLLLELCDYAVNKTIKERRNDRKKRRKAKKPNKGNANSFVSENKVNGRERHGYDSDIEKQWPETQFGLEDNYPRNEYTNPDRNWDNFSSNETNHSDRRNVHRPNGGFRDDPRSRMGY